MDARISYETGVLDERAVAPDPFVQFEAWLQAAVDAGFREPGAMTVATVAADGRPSARVVLLRGIDERGLVFFTNYESRKGLEIAQRSDVALLFYWDRLERQVRIEGSAAKVSPAESDAYFASRPRGHRLAAWASRQSTVVRDRAWLEAQVAACESRFAHGDVERPPYWGGYRVTPTRFEFWQGRPNRLHDRIVYVRDGSRWRIERLSP
ncbi:MAG TPA: pyridoxamine 5'-phosphate oxidase [Candidatus Acidoferrales bacterium]|nr:pyridoxamine 5'-phosphate oxidase [Candidatus Acidoferrales bacterium]